MELAYCSSSCYRLASISFYLRTRLLSSLAWRSIFRLLLAFSFTLAFVFIVGLFHRPCGSLLGVGCDLDGKLNALLQGISSPLVHRFHRLDVDATDHQVVLVEMKIRTDRQLLVKPKHRRTDDPVGVLQTQWTWLACYPDP